jgi:hypothetical protein
VRLQVGEATSGFGYKWVRLQVGATTSGCGNLRLQIHPLLIKNFLNCNSQLIQLTTVTTTILCLSRKQFDLHLRNTK